MASAISSKILVVFNLDSIGIERARFLPSYRIGLHSSLAEKEDYARKNSDEYSRPFYWAAFLHQK